MPKTVVIDEHEGREAGSTLREILAVLRTVGPAVSSLGGRGGGGGSLGTVVNAAASLGGKGGSATDLLKLFQQVGGKGGAGGELGAILGRAGGALGGEAGGIARLFAGAGGAGGAGAAAGAGASGLAAVAGPIGLAVMVGKMAVDDMAAKFRFAGEAAKFMGTEARALASNDTLGMFKAASDKAVSGLERLGEVSPAAKIAAEGLKAATTVVDEFKSTVDAFVTRGKQLQGYSADIAGANADAEVKRLLGDIAEAQRFEKQYSSLTNSQVDMEQAFTRALAPLKEAVLNVMSKIAEKITTLLEALEPILTALAEVLGFFLEVAATPFIALLELLADAAKAVYSWLHWGAEWESKRKKHEDLVNQVSEAIFGIGSNGTSHFPRPGTPDQREVDAAQRMNIPLFAQ